MMRQVRRAAFLVIAVWMLLSPAYVQVFGGKTGTVRAWRMFHRRGIGICSAVYYQDGQRLDRYGLFGLSRRDAPRDFRRIVDEEGAREMGRRICTKVRPGADVRVELRCGVKSGMKLVLDREENLCRS